MTGDWRMTPVYIVNRDNLDCGFKRLVGWLREVGMARITVLDNGSTWEPLLAYYDRTGLDVVSLGQNLGPHALWLVGGAPASTRFIVSDPDVAPAPECPHDLVRKMHEVFDRYPAAFKVGPSLLRTNLPACYQRRDEVFRWEQRFWESSKPEGDCYEAGIDTTFALYAAGSGPGTSTWAQQAEHLRLAPPYSFEHVPWYEDSERPSEEARWYREHADQQWRHW